MKKMFALAFGLAALSGAAQACTWSGSYTSVHGTLNFNQSGDALIGDYVRANGAFAGRVDGCQFEGVFLNGKGGQFGPVRFELDRFDPPNLTGKWGSAGRPATLGWNGRSQAQVPPQLERHSCAWAGKWLSNFGEIQLRGVGRRVTGEVRGQRLEASTTANCALIGVVDFASDRQGFKLDATGTQMSGKVFPLSGGPVQDWRGQKIGAADPAPQPVPNAFNPSAGASAWVTSSTTYRLPRFGLSGDASDPQYTSPVGLVNSDITATRHASSQTQIRIRACDDTQLENVQAKAAIVSEDRPGTTHLVNATGCFLEFDLAGHGEGTFLIDVTVSARDKATGAVGAGQKQLSVAYKTIWIAVVGDSFTSGEGAPLRAANHTENSPKRARWLHAADRLIHPTALPSRRINPHCNVSPLAWPMQAAEIMADRFPNAVFKLSNFACSGSVIAGDGDIVKISTEDRDAEGQQWLNARFSQLGHLEAAIRDFGRKPDFIFLSAGINNGDFVDVIKTAAAMDLFSHEGKFNLLNRALHISELRDLYDRLDARLSPHVSDPSRIVLAAYPDFTRNAAGNEEGCQSRLHRDRTAQSQAGTQCDLTLVPNKFGPWNLGFDRMTEISAADWKLANSAFAQPLFDQQEFAALRLGWTFAGDTAQLFAGRGICAAATVREMNQPCDSIRNQGQMQGAFHPNAKGHARVAAYIAGLLPDPTR
ncbi:MAG: hypothetical protein AAF252_06255 [Pseudomonadota bacterium]